MTWTDYAGIAGLLAATVVAAWMLLGAGTISPHRITAHRGEPRHSAPLPARPVRPARHRAPSASRLRSR